MKYLSPLSCLVTLAALPAQSPQSDHPTPSAPQSLSRVVFDQPRADGPLWACGANWKASFDGRGFTAIPFFGADAPRNFPLRLEVAKATVGGEALALRDGEAKNVGTQVVTRRGAFTEVIDTALDHVEQSFVFDAVPNRGAIVVDVRIDGEGYVPSAIENGLRFTSERGHVDYTKAIAIDGNGRRLALPIAWTGGAAHLEIPASFVETAALPIVLDPTLNGWFGLGNPALLQHDGDVATIQTGGTNGRTLLVWQRQWSLTDQDCWGLMFDNELNLVLTDFAIDFTAEDWLKVACAGNNFAQNFLVVSEVRIGLLWFIAGRTINGAGLPGTQFNIEREGVVGTPGNNFHPDVGSDPFFGPGRYTVVFNKKQLGVSDIYMRQVTTAGALVTTNAIPIVVDTLEEARPSISKSCGAATGTQQYLVTYLRQWPSPPNDWDAWGCYVSWNGVVGANFPVSVTASEESAPSPGSPIDANGQRFWPVVYEFATGLGQPRDLVGRLMRSDGVTQATFPVDNGVPGSDDRDPEVDSDGIRFLVTFTTGVQSVEATSFAFVPSTNQVRLEERTGMNTSGAVSYGQCNVVAEFSASSQPTPRYKVCFTDLTSNTLLLQNFGGWSPGSQFTTRPTQCGTLSITASGSTTLGQTTTISAGNGGLSGVIAGFPTSAWLDLALGCHCELGVDPIGFFSNPFSYTIPGDASLVGTTFSAQGFTIVGTQCLGNSIDFSNTVDFTIR